MEHLCPPISILNIWNLSNSVENGGAFPIKELFKFIQEKFYGNNYMMDGDKFIRNPY